MGASASKGDEENIQKNVSNPADPIKTKLVSIKIPTYSNNWEKPYNIEATLETIAKDFKKDNDMDNLDSNVYIQWTYNNTQIKMDSTKIKDFMAINKIDGALEIEINQDVLAVPGTENENTNIEICEIVGKPLFNPFEIFTYEPNQNVIKCKSYNKKLLMDTQLDKLSIESAYCNGNNHLYISGGVNPITRESLDLFWDINLKENELSEPIKIIPKKNHSMIYDNKKVFLVGGDDETTAYINVDTETKNIHNLPNLNMKRFEPSLIKYNNYLYCFDSARKRNSDKYSLERINLKKLESPLWEIIYPKISQKLLDNVYNQKFFGVVEDFKKDIIFVGGIYDYYSNNNAEDNENEKKTMNTKYNVKKNMMEISDIPFTEISLSEKTFFPLNNKNYFILPNFSKRAPKIVYFSKDKNTVKFSSIKSNINITKKKKNNYNFKISSQMKNSLLGLNFDMPGLHKEIDLNANKKIDNLVVISPTNNQEMDAQFKFNNNYNNNNRNNNFDFGTNININTKDIITNDINKELVNKNPSLDENSDTNIKPNQNIDANININIDGGTNQVVQRNLNTNIGDGGVNLKIGESTINPNIQTNINPQLSTKINVETNNNDIINNNDNEIDPSNIKISMKIDQENNIKDNDNKHTIDNNIKVNVNVNDENLLENKNKNKNVIPKSDRAFVYSNNYRVNFHNSVDDPCHTIRKIKVRNRPYPDDISLKMIKLKARQFLKIDNNEIRLNNY